ncbi:MAG: hypothetical protein AB8I08_10355 [Sandaracinaceae bacterium]
MRLCLIVLASVFALACTTRTETDGGPGSDTGTTGPCTEGELLCGEGETVQRCTGGERVDVETCTGDQVCANGLGCVSCRPGYFICNGSELFECNDAGSGYDLSLSCTAEEVCVAMGPLGRCNNACAEAVSNRSNIGCEYWAVDLDNEHASAGGANAWEEQFAVAIANPSDVPATVRVFLNDAALGETPVERQVFQGIAQPQDVLEINLDVREVDGPIPSNADERGTWTSPHAYRITSNYPVVAYQFNPIIQSFSNDASLLIPQSGLDNDYRVLGWPTANPIDLFNNVEGIPDHSFVTIVGTQDGTTVTVTAGGPIVGDNYGLGIGPAETGETITRTINRYEVLNLESDGRIGEATQAGDLTGTVVQSSAPVAVFSGGERGSAPADRTRIPAPPGGIPESSCCTEHLEEQVFPTTAWGRDFVMTRSPIRGASWNEPDIYRVIADREGATITTNLPAPDNTFTLAPGEWREFYSQRSFIMQSSAPVSIEQILVSQGWVDEWTAGNGGDPSMILYPPFQQFREDYIFLTPSTFSADYVVIAMPTGTSVLLDGGDINGDEFMSLCVYEDAGMLDGTPYQAVTCPVEDGSHRVEADQPVGIMIYGYYNVGSYGYAGGSDLERINPLI